MSVILVGYRGSGKSSVARCIAQQKSWKLIDTDQEIVRVAGMTIREIFEQQGELAFRQLEVAQVAEACKLENAAISLGGGAVLLDAGRHAIQVSGHLCVYLSCRLDELVRRIQADPASEHHRPSLTAHSLEVEVATTLVAREPKYRMVATRDIDVSDLTVDEVCTRIMEWL